MLGLYFFVKKENPGISKVSFCCYALENILIPIPFPCINLIKWQFHEFCHLFAKIQVTSRSKIILYRMSLDNVIQCQINIDCSPAFRKSLSAILFYCFSDLSWKESIDFPNLVNTSCNIRNINISKLFDLFLTF